MSIIVRKIGGSAEVTAACSYPRCRPLDGCLQSRRSPRLWWLNCCNNSNCSSVGRNPRSHSKLWETVAARRPVCSSGAGVPRGIFSTIRARGAAWLSPTYSKATPPGPSRTLSSPFTACLREQYCQAVRASQSSLPFASVRPSPLAAPDRPAREAHHNSLLLSFGTHHRGRPAPEQEPGRTTDPTIRLPHGPHRIGTDGSDWKTSARQSSWRREQSYGEIQSICRPCRHTDWQPR